ncbi:MAG TPA: NUDIX domain-containing protein [Solirubrobacterales bacterium]
MPAPAETSLIDVVDDRDTPVATIERGEVLNRGANFRTAHIFLLDGANNLLLQRIGARRSRHPRRWGSSVAAYLHAGETYEEAAVRRLREELGLELSLRFVGKIDMRDKASLKFVSLFVGQGGAPAIREHGHIDELEYWTAEEIDRTLDHSPISFTPTFQNLYLAFGHRLSSR